MRNLFLLLTSTFIMLASCTQKQGAMLSPDEQRAKDSLALHVAVMPCMSCLPLYYAQRTGMLDSANLDVRLLRYQAQMDIDTAITRHHAEIAISDLIRAIRLSEHVTPFLGTEEEISMVALKGKRIKKINQMKEKMVAIARLSITDFWCDRMLDSAKMEYQSIYRPQINDVKLRANMLHTGLMEGAMMTNPYSTWMVMEQNRKLYSTSKGNTRLAAWIMDTAIKTDSMRLRQIASLFSICQEATANILKGQGIETIREILIEEYGLPHEIADSIQLPTITAPSPIRVEDINTAQQWLNGRNAIPATFNKESFVTNLPE